MVPVKEERHYRLSKKHHFELTGNTPKGASMSANAKSYHDYLSHQITRRRKAIAEELPPLMPDFAKAQDAIGTIHYSRFLDLER